MDGINWSLLISMIFCFYAAFYIHAKWGEGSQGELQTLSATPGFQRRPFISPPAQPHLNKQIDFSNIVGKYKLNTSVCNPEREEPVPVIFHAGIPIFLPWKLLSPFFFPRVLGLPDEIMWGITSFQHREHSLIVSHLRELQEAGVNLAFYITPYVNCYVADVCIYETRFSRTFQQFPSRSEEWILKKAKRKKKKKKKA